MKKIKVLLLAATLSMVCLSGCGNETVGASGSETTTLAPIEVDYDLLGRVTDENGNVVENAPESGETVSADDENASDGNNNTSKPNASSGTANTKPSNGREDSSSSDTSANVEESEDEGDAFTEANRGNGSSVSFDEEEEINVWEDIYEGELTEKEILELANKGYKAYMNEEWDGTAHYTNAGLLRFFATQEWVKDEELAKELETAQWFAKDGAGNYNPYYKLAAYNEYENVELINPVPFTEEELLELNTYLEILGVSPYKITNAYKVDFKFDLMNIYGFEGENIPYMFVLECENGTEKAWKLDIYMSVLRESWRELGEFAVKDDGTGEYIAYETIDNLEDYNIILA